MNRIGVLGGTFDPVHIGHCQLANIAMAEIGLKRLLIIPAADPPHKGNSRITPFSHRVEMLRLAFAGIAGCEVSLLEGARPGPSYTIDTIRRIKTSQPNLTEIYFLIGMDAFVELFSWKSYRQLLAEVRLVVARRKTSAPETLEAALANMASHLGYKRYDDHWQASKGLQDLFFLSDAPNSVSSSGVRKRLIKGQRGIPELAPKVIDYIALHGLYGVKK